VSNYFQCRFRPEELLCDAARDLLAITKFLVPCRMLSLRDRTRFTARAQTFYSSHPRSNHRTDNMKRLVEEPGNYRFCEIEKTSFEVSKFLQRKTPAVNDGFLRNLLHSICVNSKMQLLSQNFQI